LGIKKAEQEESKSSCSAYILYSFFIAVGLAVVSSSTYQAA